MATVCPVLLAGCLAGLDVTNPRDMGLTKVLASSVAECVGEHCEWWNREHPEGCLMMLLGKLNEITAAVKELGPQ